MSFRNVLTKWFSRKRTPIQNPKRNSRTSKVKPTFEMLDDRIAPAITNFSLGVLTVDLNNANEAATLTNSGGNITLTSNNTITGAGPVFATASVTKLVLIDPGNNAGQSIAFAGASAYSLSGGLDSTGVETNTFNAAVTATGASSILAGAQRPGSGFAAGGRSTNGTVVVKAREHKGLQLVLDRKSGDFRYD